VSVELITYDKWEKLKALSDAIVRQRAIYEDSKTYQNALDLQNLENQRIALRATVGFAVIEGGRKDARQERHAAE
jgi:hypothetical protein